MPTPQPSRPTFPEADAGLVTGPVGCFFAWRRLAYFGETIAHSSPLGVAFAIVISIDLVIGILAGAALACPEHKEDPSWLITSCLRTTG